MLELCVCWRGSRYDPQCSLFCLIRAECPTLGNSCFCGNKMFANDGGGILRPSSDCSTPCAGDVNQSCGALNRIVVYRNITDVTAIAPTMTSGSTASSSTSAPQSGWTSTGCFSDIEIGSNRALSTLTRLSNNTAATCTTLCESQGATFSGLEYGTSLYRL